MKENVQLKSIYSAYKAKIEPKSKKKDKYNFPDISSCDSKS